LLDIACNSKRVISSTKSRAKVPRLFHFDRFVCQCWLLTNSKIAQILDRPVISRQLQSIERLKLIYWQYTALY